MILGTAIRKDRYVQGTKTTKSHAGVGMRKDTPLNCRLRSEQEERVLKLIQLAEQGKPLF